MKKAYLLIIVIIGALGLYLIGGRQATKLISPPSPTPKVVDYVASFEIVTLGTKRDFSDPKYHNINDYAYLSALDPQFVHLKKEGVTWQEFFDSLPMKLTKECLTTGTGQVFCTNDTKRLIFTLNYLEDANALDKEITPGAKLLVEYK